MRLRSQVRPRSTRVAIDSRETSCSCPQRLKARARASVVDQLDKDALRDVEVHATTEAVTVVARGRVGLTLLNLLHTADVDVVVTATATPRRSS